MKTKRALRNTAIQAGTQVATWALSWVLLVMLPRYLGDAGFGTLFLALSYGMVLGTLMNLGINTYLAKQTAILNPVDADDGPEKERREDELRALLGEAVFLKLFLGVIVYGIMAGLVFVLPYDAETRHAILIIGLSVCLSGLTQTAGAGFQGLEAMGAPNLALIAEKVVLTAASVVLLQMGYGLIPVCWVYVVAAAVNAGLSLVALRRKTRLRPRWNSSAVKGLLAGGLPFLIWIVAGEIYVRIDVLMLSFMAPESVVGWYGAAFRLYGTLLFVPHILNTAVFPPLARLGADENDLAALGAATRRVLNLLLLVSVPIAAGIALAARPLVVLLYGAGPFEGSIVPLMIFGACIVPVCVDTLLGSVLIARGRQLAWSCMAIAAAVFNPLMNLWTIPLTQEMYGNGGIGAGAATLLTELLMMAGALWLMPKGVLSLGPVKTFLKAAVCAGVMAAVILVPGIQNLLVVVVVGVVTYGLAAVGLRVLPPEDLHHLLHALGMAGRFPHLERLLGIPPDKAGADEA